MEAEIEAAADWVAHHVLEGTALEDIAVLVPSIDPLAALVSERLARSPGLTGIYPSTWRAGFPSSARHRERGHSLLCARSLVPGRRRPHRGASRAAHCGRGWPPSLPRGRC